MNEEIPFKSKPIPSEIDLDLNHFSHFKEIDKDIILREESLYSFFMKFSKRSIDLEKEYSNSELLEDGGVSGINYANKLLAEIKKAGVRVPLTGFVIGKDKNGEAVVYTVAKKIEGKRLMDVDFSKENKEEVQGKIEKAYLSLLFYYKEKNLEFQKVLLENKEKNENKKVYFLGDVGQNKQMMYGRAKGDTEDCVYMVDLDVLPDDRDSALLFEIDWLSKHIKILEEKLNMNFPKLYKEMLSILY